MDVDHRECLRRRARAGWTRAALMTQTVEQMFESRNKLSGHAGGGISDGRCRREAGQRRDGLQIRSDSATAGVVQLSGPLASKSTLSEFWLMPCRASEPTKKRLDGTDQVVQSGPVNFAFAATRTSSRTDVGVGDAARSRP